MPSILSIFVSSGNSRSFDGKGGGISFSLPFRPLLMGGGNDDGGLYGITVGDGIGGTDSCELNIRRSGRSLLRERVLLIAVLSPVRSDDPCFLNEPGPARTDSVKVVPLSKLLLSDGGKECKLTVLCRVLMKGIDVIDLKDPAFGGGVGCTEENIVSQC